MEKEIFISETSLESRIAILEDKELVELYIETPKKYRMISNIYYGKIEKVIDGMGAAFIEIGESQNAFLPFSQITKRHGLPRKKERIIGAGSPTIEPPIHSSKELKEGKYILVQVIKEPYFKKGSGVTTDISLAGRYSVLVPFSKNIGISRKIKNNKKRSSLKKMANELVPDGFGLIIRTEAENKEIEYIKDDVKDLLNSWKELEKKVKNTNTPQLVHKEMSTSSSVIRDLFTSDVDRVIIDDKSKYKDIRSYVNDIDEKLLGRIFYHKSGSLFGEYGISKQIEKYLRRKVWLKNSSYLIIEQTEALLSIDVNSGRFVGKKDREKNILEVNLLAANEIARQLRLRNNGGLIVIDFIDLTKAQNKILLENELKKELKKDKAVTTTAKLSKFGLLEMTRQRISNSLIFSMSDVCPVCHGNGRIPSKQSMISKIEMWIKRFRLDNKAKRIFIHIHPNLMEFINENHRKLFRRIQWKHLLKITFLEDTNISIGEFKVFMKKNSNEVTEKY